MPQLILILAILVLAYIGWRWFSQLPEAKRRSARLSLLIWGVAIVVLLLVVTGRLHWLGGAFAALLAVGRVLLPVLLRMLPFLAQARAQARQRPPPAAANTMTTEEAFATLGLKPGASRDDIITAHRQLMSKLHPDKGGNDFLAAKLNKAKEIALASL